MNKLVQNTTQIYKPSEIIGIFNTILARQYINAKVVYLRGVYLTNGKQCYNGYFYDILRDEKGQEELTLRLSQEQRVLLKNGNLVNIGGILNRSINNKGYIQISLNVSRIDIVKEQVIDESEIKRIELRQRKASIGFKNVDTILENMLFTDHRPKVALVFAQTSITMSDFQAGINAARSAIDFDEHRVNFANASEFTSLLKRLDKSNYDIISIVRGGGSGIEHLDEISVLETIIIMTTPIIGAIGHVDEKLFIKQLVDKVSPTPNGLGQYFSDMVEAVNEKKTRSRAVLTNQIRKQFEKQIEVNQKQNKVLQERLKTLTETHNKTSEEQNKQVKEAQKLNKGLQERLRVLTATQQDATKKHAEQMQATQKQNKDLQENLKKLNENQRKLQEQHNKQQEQLTKNLSEVQRTNSDLQKNIQQITTQNDNLLKRIEQERENAKKLESQLLKAQNKSNSSGIWTRTAIIIIITVILLLYVLGIVQINI